jgi:diguanylate cyclase (GGDEF)-like protein
MPRKCRPERDKAISLRALRDLLLTRDPKQRIILAHAGLGSALMLMAIALMHAMTWLGVNDGSGLWAWTVVSALGLVAMFLAIRLGWSARLDDPSLSVPQMLYAVGCTAGAYRVAGAGHGVALLMVAIVLMFGMFGLKRRQAWLIGAYSITAFGIAMHTGARARPDVFVPHVQEIYFLSFVLFVCGLMAVSGRVAAMRQRLRTQRAELAQAVERIKLLAAHDELTGLPNRRAMTALLEAERHRSIRSGHQWSVAVLDVDNFKRVNDLYGHAAGDEALRVVARVCDAAVRKYDTVSRWGGEEYVILFRDIDPERALAAAGRLLSALEATPIVVGDIAFRVTASIGVAAYAPEEETRRTLSRADQALYEAKAAGRNRVHAGMAAEAAVAVDVPAAAPT